MAVRDMVAPLFQRVWSAVVSNVEAMPERGFEFRPEGLETRSFREIALHLANATVMFGENIGKDTWERVVAFPPDDVRAKDTVVGAMRRAGERFVANLPRLTDQEEARMVTAPWGARMPQAQLVAASVPHTFYHHGQLTIYLRMQGVTPLFLPR
jgi:uncharacterized damage-inducible protein DinB